MKCISFNKTEAAALQKKKSITKIAKKKNEKVGTTSKHTVISKPFCK